MGLEVPIFLGKSEIRNDCSTVLQKDVGQFKVPMEEAALRNVNESANDVLGEFKGFVLGQSLLFLDESPKVASFTQISDDVAGGCFPDNIEAFENIGMLEFGECLYLAIEHFPAGGIFDSFHIDNLDGHSLIYVNVELLLSSLHPL